MFGEFNIISMQNDITEIIVDDTPEQRNCFILNVDIDLSIKTVTEASVLLYDTTDNSQIDCFISYSRRAITITPKLISLVPGRTYKAVLISGEDGIKDIFGITIEVNLEYEIVANDNIVLQRPVIISPVNNSTISDVLVSIDFNGADRCVVEIDDSPKFASPLYSEEVLMTDFTPAFTFEEKQYYIRAKAKKDFVDESTGNPLTAESYFTKTYQFFYSISSGAAVDPIVPQGISIVKQKPSNEETMISDNAIMALTDTDFSAYTVTIDVYSSEMGLYDFYKDDILSFASAGELTAVTGTPTVANKLIKFVIDTIENNMAYYVIITSTDASGNVTTNTFSFTTSARALYIDYDYMKTSVSNFDVTREYVMDKVSKACDMADYVSMSKIKAGSIKFKVKEYVRHKALLDIVADYQLGYVQMFGGNIGSFSFTLSNANVNSVDAAIKYLQGQIKYWESTLKGYEKPGNAIPDYGTRSSTITVSRATF